MKIQITLDEMQARHIAAAITEMKLRQTIIYYSDFKKLRDDIERALEELE